MNLQDLRFAFNRAFFFSFSGKKWLLTFLLLALCGLLVVFFRALGMNANEWILLSLSFLPIFLCSGLLLSLGVVLVRAYHDEIKQKPFTYRGIMLQSWELMLGVFYFTIPIILSYLTLWMLLGIFLLLRDLPLVGQFFAVILAFGPFLINLVSLALALFSLSLLFVVAPVVALNGLNHVRVTQIIIRRLQHDPFSNLFFGLVALLPLLLLFGLLILAWVLTGSVCYSCHDPMYIILQWFILMIPFSACLSPAIVFFFNFAAEAHVMLQKQLKSPQ